MDRRSCLLTGALLLAAVALTVAGCGDDVTPEPAFPKPTFITSDPAFTDYRPAVDASGTQVLFERTPIKGTNPPTTLYLATAIMTSSQTVAPFLSVPSTPPATYPIEQTRPDWSWVTGEVAFSGAPTVAGTLDVHVASANGKTLNFIANTAAHIYPIWSSDGTQLITYNNSGSAAPVMPVTTLITNKGAVVAANLNGRSANNVDMFAGFAAPQPGNAMHIAYAGQPAIPSWGLPPGPPPPAAAAYNQDNNYVFLNAATGGYSSAPLEPKANISTFDPAYQGRAPYWSPDGKYVVFESSRAGGYALFLANVAEVSAGRARPVQITDANYWAQHGKFFPDGTRIVYTALQIPNLIEFGPRGIAIVDISAYLK